ncbi:MAG TPA: hypothetical protein VGK19_25165 [Capsulimonadaceae bacterium]
MIHAFRNTRYAFAVTAAAFALAGCSPPKATVPTTFTRFVASDTAFSCDAPTGWKADGYAAGAVSSGVKFTSGDGVVSVETDEAGSFMSDALSSPSNVLQGATPSIPTPPVEKMHAMTGRRFAKDLSDYVELSTVSKMTQYGDSRVTEYTAKNVHGYRVTVLGRERRMSIVCRCSPEEWDALNPSFTRIIGSVAPGRS